MTKYEVTGDLFSSEAFTSDAFCNEGVSFNNGKWEVYKNGQLKGSFSTQQEAQDEYSSP